jgi:hypothetical protein
MAEIERVSSTGGFCWHPATGEMTCTDEVYRILELDATVPVTLQLMGTRIHPEDLALLDDMFEKASAQASEFEYQLRLRTDRVKYLLVSARRGEDPDDQAQYIGAIQDVTRRRLSEDALGNALRVGTAGTGVEPGSPDGVDRARGQSAASGDHDQRQHVP